MRLSYRLSRKYETADEQIPKVKSTRLSTGLNKFNPVGARQNGTTRHSF